MQDTDLQSVPSSHVRRNTVKPILCCMSNCAFVEWSSHDVLPPGMCLRHGTLCCAASAMAGTALVYPGWKYINWGVHITEHPMVVSGMGAVCIPRATVPVMTVVIVTFIFLVMRTFLMRGDDPFHVVLWVRMPLLFCRALQCADHVDCFVPHLSCVQAWSTAIA